MNLPNKITIMRVVLVPFFVACMLVDTIPYNNYMAAAIFMIACCTDAVDGYLARKYELVTNFGKFIDPLADKLLVCSALICFVAVDNIPMPAVAVIIIISREFIISGFRLIASDNGVVIAASYWGKFKTIAQMLMSILLILQMEGKNFEILEQILIIISVLLTVISLVDYIAKNRNVLLEDKH